MTKTVGFHNELVKKYQSTSTNIPFSKFAQMAVRQALDRIEPKKEVSQHEAQNPDNTKPTIQQ